MSDPYRSPTPPRESVSLRIRRSAWWRTHGLMNLFSLLNGVLFTVLPVLILVGCRPSWRDALSFVLLALVGALAVVANQGVLRSLVAVVSDRPYLTVSDWGLEVDAGFLDRWSFPWSAIDAVAPELPYLEQQLRRNAFVCFTIRLREKPRRRLASDIQHGRFPDIFEMGRHFARLSPHEIAVLLAHLESHVRRFELFLVTDME